MQDVVRAMYFVMAAGAFFMLVMVAEALYQWKKTGKSGYYLKETLANMASGFSYKLVDGIAIALFITVFAHYLNNAGLHWQFSSPLVEFVLIFVLADMLFYIQHFTAHKVRWFWSVHATHHSSDHFNFSIALRQNFLTSVMGVWAFQWVPLAYVGFNPDLILLAVEVNLFYQFFVHTETVGRLGWLEKVFNTPSHHRVHHGSNPQQVDRNFGGVFILWDRLFGTFRDERDAGNIVYGVTRMPNNKNPLDMQLYELVNMFKDAWHYKDIRVFFKHPDWIHNKEH